MDLDLGLNLIRPRSAALLLACRYGFIVAVTKVIEIGRGKLSDAGDGLANFPIRYSAVIFKPFRGEVMDCVVTQVGID